MLITPELIQQLDYTFAPKVYVDKKYEPLVADITNVFRQTAFAILSTTNPGDLQDMAMQKLEASFATTLAGILQNEV